MVDVPEFNDGELQRAWINFVTASADDDLSMEDIDTLTEEAARVDDVAVDAAVAELISDHHAMNKTDAKRRIKEFRSEQNIEQYEFGNVTKYVSPMTHVDPKYEVSVSVGGERETLTIEAEQIVTFGRFKTEFFKVFDQPFPYIEDDEWDELLAETFQDANVEVTTEYEGTPEYAVVERLLTQLPKYQIETDLDEVTDNPRNRVYYDEAADELLLPMLNVEQQMDMIPGEPDAGGVRDLAAHRDLFTDPENPIRQIENAGGLRMWRLSPAQLIEAGAVTAAALEPDDETDYE